MDAKFDAREADQAAVVIEFEQTDQLTAERFAERERVSTKSDLA